MKTDQVVEKKPAGFEDDLGPYDVLLFDSSAGVPVAWGFRLVRHLEPGRLGELVKFGQMECLDRLRSQWGIITKTLTRQEAEAKYGGITEEIRGPRGGWKSVTFGTTRFISRYLEP